MAWNKGLVNENAKHAYKRFKKDCCERCGFIPEDPCQLDVDHKDGNHKNHDPNNLQTLCANCHRLKSKQNKAADFIVVSPQVGALLMDSPSFVMPDQSKETELQNHAMYPAGRLGSIKVFVNAYMKNGNTFKIVAGRKTSNNQPGVYLAEYTKEFLNIDMARISDGDELNPSGSEKIVLKSRHAQVEVGKDPASCYLTVEFDMSPLPWWKKLLNL